MSEKSNIIKLKNLVEDWEGEYERSIKEKPERKDRFNNLSWTEIKPLYTLCDLEDVDYEEDIGLPGRYPYTRGVHTSMYRSRPWTVRQVMGFGGGQESSKRSDFLQKHGQTGFNVVFDHPTNLGLDSDDENADGFVGREGTAIDTIHDMRELLDDINMESESISLVSAHPAILAMVVAIALERGINIENLSGTLQNYPMIGHTMGGCTDASPHYSKRFCLDIVEYCSRNLPRWNSTSVASGQSRAAGCTAVQEIAFGIGSALAIIKGCMERGIGVDEIAPRVSFLLIADRDIFEEVAKFRAMRRLWARILKEEMGAKNPKSCQLRFHCHTAGHALTYQQPMINIVRSTIHGLSAVLGGCQSLHISSADEGFAIPTEESAKLSLRTQQIILDESGAADTIDPLAGSYYVESLTNQFEQEARNILNTIDSMGEWWDIKVREWVSAQIEESSFKLLKEVESGERVVVAMNKYVEDDKCPFQVWNEDRDFQIRQINKLNMIKDKRDKKLLAKISKDLLNACKSNENILPVTIEAVKADMTIGDITKIYSQDPM